MWGYFVGFDSEHVFPRFIPTHVGLLSWYAVYIVVMTVHPHTCGVTFFDAPPHITQFGSSPHMWGYLIGTAFHLHTARFIPTHVGLLYLYAESVPTSTVHPHTCGVTGDQSVFWNISVGSSPHMWGYCGPNRQNRAGRAVHPHTCGVTGKDNTI